MQWPWRARAAKAFGSKRDALMLSAGVSGGVEFDERKLLNLLHVDVAISLDGTRGSY